MPEENKYNYCPHCGAKIIGLSNYCGECGKELDKNNNHADMNKSLIEKAMDSMNPLEREEYKKTVKASGPRSIITLIVGVSLVLYSLFTFIDEKNRYYGFSHAMTSKELFAGIIGICGVILTLFAIVVLVFYNSTKDKL